MGINQGNPNQKKDQQQPTQRPGTTDTRKPMGDNKTGGTGGLDTPRTNTNPGRTETKTMDEKKYSMDEKKGGDEKKW